MWSRKKSQRQQRANGSIQVKIDHLSCCKWPTWNRDWNRELRAVASSQSSGVRVGESGRQKMKIEAIRTCFRATERLCTANLCCSTKRKLVVVYDYCGKYPPHTSTFSPESICIQPQIWKTVVDLRKIMNMRHMMVRSEVATAMPAKIVATCNETLVSISCKVVILLYAEVQIAQLTCDDIDGMSIISSSLPTQLSLSSFFSHTRHSPIRPPVSDSESPTHSVGKKEKFCCPYYKFIYAVVRKKVGAEARTNYPILVSLTTLVVAPCSGGDAFSSTLLKSHHHLQLTWSYKANNHNNWIANGEDRP